MTKYLIAGIITVYLVMSVYTFLYNCGNWPETEHLSACN